MQIKKNFKFLTIPILISICLINLQINLTKSTTTEKVKSEGTKQNETCVDTNGKPVDWYIILLFPKKSSSESLSYGYFDNKSTELSYHEYNKENFPPLFFTKDLDNKKQTNFVFWNDDKTTENLKAEAPISKAHSKGSLIYNSNTGKFLMHSLPRFPRRTDKDKIVNDLPDNAGIYGQHFFCLSLEGKEAANMVDNLTIINPSIVHKHGLKDLVGFNKEVVENFLAEKKFKNREKNIFKPIKTIGGFELDLFAKSNLGDLPFEKIVPEQYKENIFVETWSKPEQIKDICGKYKIRNIQQLKFGEFAYDKNQEHSKWAVMEKKGISCFSDLNRIESQKKRGGMTICVTYEKLAKIMRSGIIKYDKCDKDNDFNLNLRQKENLMFLE